MADPSSGPDSYRVLEDSIFRICGALCPEDVYATVFRQGESESLQVVFWGFAGAGRIESPLALFLPDIKADAGKWLAPFLDSCELALRDLNELGTPVPVGKWLAGQRRRVCTLPPIGQSARFWSP